MVFERRRQHVMRCSNDDGNEVDCVFLSDSLGYKRRWYPRGGAKTS